jgi:hypothetical protein
MNLKRNFSPKDPARPGAGRHTRSPVSTPGPLFDLPPVQASQQATFMRLTTGFSTRAEHPDELDLQAVCEVLESVYEPRRRFWRELESNTVLEAIYCYAPSLRSVQERTECGSHTEFVWRIEEGMFLLQALERCAELLLDTASASRPEGVAHTYQWLHAELLRRGEFFLLSSLESGGTSAIAHIHRMVAALGSSPALPPECVPERGRRGQRRQGAS